MAALPGTGVRPGPLGLAAIAAALLALFGIGAVVIPAVFADTGPSNSTAPAAPLGSDPAEPGTTTEPTPATATATATASPTSTLVAVSFNPDFEDRVVQLINGERHKAHCQPVRVNDRLRATARAHSAGDNSSFADRARKAGYPQPLDESDARGGDKPQDIVHDWLHNDHDRSNLLNCDARSIGVGVAYRGKTPFWTTDTGSA